MERKYEREKVSIFPSLKVDNLYPMKKEKVDLLEQSIITRA